MADARAALLARIKKCLALARSANEAEAAAALAAARRMMDEYGVDQVEIELADVEEHRASASGAQRPPMWEVILVGSVARAIPTKILQGGDGYTFIGLAPAPELASYAFTVLYRQLRRARADYIRVQLKRCSVARKRKRADLFCEGWAHEVYRQVAKLHPEQPIDPIVRQYLDQRHADLATVKPRAAGLSGRVAEDDRARGRERGRGAQLNHGVGANAAPLRIGRTS